MKVMIVTTPIRPIPTDYPPFGSLSVISHLKRNGISDVTLYHVDALRPDYADVLDHIEAERPDVLGISGVVSTAYEYVKRLAGDVKQRCPDMLTVLGGNLAASAEIVLKKTAVDLCVIGEGERVFLNVVRRAETTRNPSEFSNIPGLALLDERGAMMNTGYEEPVPAEDVYDVDLNDLWRASDPDMYIYPAFRDGELNRSFRDDPRCYEAERANKKHATMVASKGCVARCTFCHRWDKGIRYIPVPRIMERLDALIEERNVGFVEFGDENFGTHHKWLSEFCSEIKKRNVMWDVKGMRVNRITPEHIAMMKDAGCVSIVYGMETGSAKMLEVMEKKTSIEANHNAMQWTVEAGLFTVIQLVVGMPGESPETIRETIEFSKFGMTLSPAQNPNDLSINYAQALPGTPLYEFGRQRGMIGTDLDSEEDYLLRISDKNAHDETTTLNFTDYPTLECQTWRPLITVETNYAYVKKYGIEHYRQVLLKDTRYFSSKKDSGYFANPRRLLDTTDATDTINDVREAHELNSASTLPSLWSLVKERKLGLAMVSYPVLFYRLRHFMWLMVLFKNLSSFPMRKNIDMVMEYAAFKVGLKGDLVSKAVKAKSLRGTVWDDIGSIAGDASDMEPLRRGR